MSYIGGQERLIQKTNYGRQALNYCQCESEKGHPITGNCLRPIYNQKVIDFSKSNFGKIICFDCQKHEEIK